MLGYGNSPLQTELLQWIPQGFLLPAFWISFSVSLASVAFTFIHDWPFLNAISLMPACKLLSSSPAMALCRNRTSLIKCPEQPILSQPTCLTACSIIILLLALPYLLLQNPPSSETSRLSWWLQKFHWLHLVLAGAEPSKVGSWNGYGDTVLWSQTMCFVKGMFLILKNMRWLRQGMMPSSVGKVGLRNQPQGRTR